LFLIFHTVGRRLDRADAVRSKLVFRSTGAPAGIDAPWSVPGRMKKMAESGGNLGVLDAKQFIYVPKWVKIAILASAAVLLLLAAVSVIRALTSDSQGESIVFFVSVAQTATLVLIFFLLITFSRRDANVEQLHHLTDEFLRFYIAGALRKVSIPALGIEGFDVQDEGAKDIFGRLLSMKCRDYTFRIWVGLNVRRLFVIYFVPLDDGITIDDVQRIFSFTFGGARKIRYECNFEIAHFEKEPFISIWSTVETQDDLLSSPQDKLFWAQDVAMQTESFLRTAHRNHINLKLGKVSPGPL